MNTYCTIQVFQNQQWQSIATVECQQPIEQGWQTASSAAYLLEYAVDHLDQRNAAALSWACPVTLDTIQNRTWPPFLMDLLPQGFGRQELLKHLGLTIHAEASGDWPLLLAGAGNPIGHLRVLEASEWLKAQSQGTQIQGFTQQDIIERSEYFLENLALYGAFITGSSGVQGEWPKLLLTEAKDGLFYLDHALPDHEAHKHWLVKFYRGQDPQLAKIFQHEAAYMRLAKFLGLRVHGDLHLTGRALFIPRFDRSIHANGVERHAQESIAVLCGRAGFGVRISHNEICRTLAQACTDPLTEIIEYLKRDITNIALGNKDNHTRNTAVTRNWNGQVSLTPLFDFAPMWLHPDGIARVTRWEKDDMGSPHWLSVIQQIEDLTGIAAQQLKHALIDWLPQLQRLINQMELEEISTELIEQCRPRIHEINRQIEEMKHG
ncbi:MAG: HipA domain-containing protein [Gammaproteobacteria bacterium]|nr:HipA domain-containing protein [Gammaproteobacteria bacterium]